jgi:tol-pal system protein YbgF
MKAIRAIVASVVVLAGFPAAPAHAAANKEHQQLMAEIRMLQEQQQQLQQLLGSLSDALKAVSTKIDDQSAAMRKAMADQALTINTVGENVRVVREKVDDTNVRVSSVSQEIEALRQTIVSSQPGTQTAAPLAPGTDPGAAAAGATTPPTGQPAQPNVNPIPSGVSPQKMWDASFDDYTAGRFDIAILGFQSYVQAYPRTPKAADAQFYIGQSLFSQGKWKDAQDAFQKVITDYPQSPAVPGAYYKLGQTFERMNQIDNARKAYDTVVKNFPDATDTQLARQALERLNRREP